jgi:alpha-glucan phosphorylase-like protein
MKHSLQTTPPAILPRLNMQLEKKIVQNNKPSLRIAYFSMELGIRNDIPTYSGGLGILAGDVIRSCADLMVPMVGVTLVSRKGYLKQKLTSTGEQIESPDGWTPENQLELTPKTVQIRIEGREVTVQAWRYNHISLIGNSVPILFLDTDNEANSPEDRKITDTLYGGDENYRLKQEIILGIGGTRMLEALDFKITKYHMNEGHSALLTLELLKNGTRKSKRPMHIHNPHPSPISIRPVCVPRSSKHTRRGIFRANNQRIRRTRQIKHDPTGA